MEEKKGKITLGALALSDEDMVVTEEALTYSRTLDRVFDRLIKEMSDAIMRSDKVWSRLREIAKEQFPWFDDEVHFLAYNNVIRKVVIHNIKDKDLFLHK